MAKKKETKIEMEETPEVVETPQVVEKPKVQERLKPSNESEIKDRAYYLKGNRKPLSRMIK